MKVCRIAKRRLSGDFGSYAWWFHRQVRESLNDPRPTIPHDQVMAEMEVIIREAELKRATSGSALL